MKTSLFNRIIALITALLIPLNSIALADVLIELDITGIETGPLETIENTGSLEGDFEAEFDIPNVETIDGVNAVTLDGNMDWYVGPDSSLLAGSADRSVEAWVWNPEVPAEETIVAWGRRGGPDASNWSMLYGNHGTWGALGGWGGAADMPFVAGASEAPAINEWHHLVLTYNGQTNERAIYVDGALSNSENDGPIFNTHETDTSGAILPIVLGNQNENSGIRTDNLSAALSIAKVKIHDESLTLEEVQQSYNQDMEDFGKGGPVIISFDSSSSRVEPEETVILTWDIDGAETITIDNGIGDVTNEDEYEVNPEETTTYTITASNDEGLTKELSITIFVLDSGALIDIDLTTAELGPLPTIINNGSLSGDFEAEFDVPNVETIDGVNAVTLDGFNDWYVGPDSTPLTGGADRSVEAWVWNPSVPAEETIIAWGRRGGPDATNWSMLYGNHGTWGALGGWGGSADMPFQAGGGAPSINEWHHLVLTYDGASNERAIYVDGELSNSENDGPTFNTHETDTSGTPLPIVIGNQNENNGTRTDNLSAELSIAKLKVLDYSLTLEEVQNSFDASRATFGKGGPRISSFYASANPINENDSVTLAWDIGGAVSISIDNGIGDVTDLDEIEVQPDETTSYTITATDEEGTSQERELIIYIIGKANLIHQWTFDENGGAGTILIDSIGGADGTIVDEGSNDGTVGDGKVTLTGGGKNDTDYVRFPPNLVSPLSNMTIETWSTQHSSQNWSRVFSVGSATNNALHMSFSRGTNINQNEMRWNAGANLTLQDFGGAPPNPIDEQVHWVLTVNDVGGPNGETQITIFKNGEEVRNGNTNNDLSGLNDVDFFLGRSQWGDNTANASWDEFRIYDGLLTSEQIQSNTESGPTLATDSDGDGIADSIEDRYDFLDAEDPNDAALDQDNDGLSNLQEVDLGSDLEEQDTDNDGIIDGEEVAAKTSPTEADTDNDQLNDGDELIAGTDPLDPDTDGDKISDGIEVENNSDPLDPNSLPKPKLPELIHRWAFDENGDSGTVLIDSVGGAHGIIEDAGTNDGSVADGRVTLNGGGKSNTDFVRLPANLVSPLQSATIETWSTHYSAQNWSRVFSVGSSSSNVMHMSFSRGTNINQNELRWNAQTNMTLQDFGGAPPNPLNETIHWVVTIDDTGGPGGETKVVIYKDGDEVRTGNTSNDLSGLTDTDFFLGRSQWNDNTANASWEDFRIYDGAMDPIAVKFSNAQGPDTAPGQIPFQITNITYYADSQTADVTWNSKPGLNYIIWISEDGEEWADVDDAFESEGDSTTYTDIEATSQRLLIRVEVSE
ncbi:hypothetical protein OAK04_01740 [Verrucomicrobia bacterium]|nr:hypothetical protein [Verrucomicrobiota bacterium]